MKTFKKFKNQEIIDLQSIKGGAFIRRGMIKKKQTIGYEEPSYAMEANGKGTKRAATSASGKPQLL